MALIMHNSASMLKSIRYAALLLLLGMIPYSYTTHEVSHIKETVKALLDGDVTRLQTHIRHLSLKQTTNVAVLIAYERHHQSALQKKEQRIMGLAAVTTGLSSIAIYSAVRLLKPTHALKSKRGASLAGAAVGVGCWLTGAYYLGKGYRDLNKARERYQMYDELLAVVSDECQQRLGQ